MFAALSSVNAKKPSIRRLSPHYASSPRRSSSTEVEPQLYNNNRSKNRHSFSSEKDLEAALTSFNSDSDSFFVCVGRANVKLKLCRQCCDVQKSGAVDMYYIDRMDVSQTRNILCRGCMVNKLVETNCIVN